MVLFSKIPGANCAICRININNYIFNMQKYLSNLWNFAIKSIFPPKCVRCNDIVTSDATLCLTCWNNIEFIEEPSCKQCGIPFKFDIKNSSICIKCNGNTFCFDSASSIFKYDKFSKKIIHNLKYGDKTYLSNYLATWVKKKIFTRSTHKYNWIVSVPMHRKQLNNRLYNQSTLLAKSLSKKLNVPFLNNALIKTKYTHAQTSMNKYNRRTNIKDSFAFNDIYKTLIKNSSIILIDDVYTTGATLNECSKILKKHHCSQIKVVTIARTII